MKDIAMCDDTPQGMYRVWCDPRRQDSSLCGRWLSNPAMPYEEAIKVADKMNRANHLWHYYAKPVPS